MGPICIARVESRMMTPEQRRRVIQAIWRRAPSLPLHSRMETLRRAQQLYRVPEIVTLGRFPGGGESDSR